MCLSNPAGSWPAHGPAAATCCWGQTLRDLPTEELPLCLAHFLREERRERRYKEHFPATGFFSCKLKFLVTSPGAAKVQFK